MSKFKIFFIVAVFLFTGCSTLYVKDTYETDSRKVSATSSQESQVSSQERAPAVKVLEYKVCPVCLREFPPSVEYCPYDGTKLR